MAIPAALDPIVASSVTFFRTRSRAYLAYFGSTLWMLCLLAYNVVLANLAEFSPYAVLLNVLVGANVLTYTSQTVDVLFFHMRFWPVVALYWAAQLTSIALSGALVGAVFSDHRGGTPPGSTSVSEASMQLMAILLLIGEGLFTSSQFSVTLEYLHRTHKPTPPARPPIAPALPRTITRR